MFPSVETQQLRYHQMIFDQRAKTHKNLVRWYRRKVKGMGPAKGKPSVAMITAYKAIAHHAEAAGMTTVSTCRMPHQHPFHTRAHTRCSDNASRPWADRFSCRRRSSTQHSLTWKRPSAREHV